MTQSGDPERVQGRPGGDGHHRPGAVPAGGSGPGGGVLGIVMKHRVDRDGLQPGIPGAACLGRPGIHLGSCEADIAPEGQNKDTDCVMILLGYGARRFVDDDVQNRAHQRQGLLQRDDPGQGGGGHREDLGGDQRGRRILRRVDEHRDTQAGHCRDLVTGSFRQGSVKIMGRTDAVQ